MPQRQKIINKYIADELSAEDRDIDLFHVSWEAAKIDGANPIDNTWSQFYFQLQDERGKLDYKEIPT